MFGRQAGDAEQALCLDSDEDGLRIALEDIAAVPGKLRYMTLFMP